MNYFKLPSQTVADPTKMSLNELKQYKGVDYQKLCRIFKNAMRGKSYFLFPIGLTIASIPVMQYMHHLHISGLNNKGGDMLTLRTKMSEDDIRYNRELQKLRFLSEPNFTKLSEDTESVLAIKRMGGKADLHAPTENFVKSAPHPKLM